MTSSAVSQPPYPTPNKAEMAAYARALKIDWSQITTFLVIFLGAAISAFFLPDAVISRINAAADFPWSPFSEMLACPPEYAFQDRMLAARFVAFTVASLTFLVAAIIAFRPRLRPIERPEWASRPWPLYAKALAATPFVMPTLMFVTKARDHCAGLLGTPVHFVIGVIGIAVWAFIAFLWLKIYKLL